MSNRDFERAWHDASNESPPANVDSAIIAAARKSVPEPVEQTSRDVVRVQSRKWFTQYQPLAAAAAIAGLAFVLVQTLPREHDLALPMQREESVPAAAAAKSPPAISPARTETDESQPSTAGKSSNARERVVTPSDPPAQGAVPAPPAPPAVAADAAEESAGDAAARVGAISTEQRKAVAPQSADRAEIAGAAAVSASASAAVAASSPAREAESANAATPDTSAWVARIVTLHEAGDLPAAAQALRAFRAAEPRADTYLPDSLGDWAATVH